MMNDFIMTPRRVHEIELIVEEFQKERGDGKTPLERARAAYDPTFWDTETGHMVESMLKDSSSSDYKNAVSIQTIYWYNEESSSDQPPIAVEDSLISSPGSFSEIKTAAEKILEQVGGPGEQAVALAKQKYHPDLFRTAEGKMLLGMLGEDPSEVGLICLKPPERGLQLFADKLHESEFGKLLLHWIEGIRDPNCIYGIDGQPITTQDEDDSFDTERNVIDLGDCCGPDIHDEMEMHSARKMSGGAYDDPANWPIRGHAPQFPGDGDEDFDARHQKWIKTDPLIGEHATSMEEQVKHEVAEMGFAHTPGKIDCYMQFSDTEFYVQPLCAVNNTPLGCIVGSSYWRRGHLKTGFEEGQRYVVHRQDVGNGQKQVIAVQIFLSDEVTIRMHGKELTGTIGLDEFNKLFGTNIIEQVDGQLTYYTDPGLGIDAIIEQDGTIGSIVFAAPGVEWHQHEPIVTD